MPRPVIALLTDFGGRDHYVGVMKGVVLGICRDATLVDISHEVPAHDVTAASLELAAAYEYFPPGTTFLVVVDPGVGSARRAIAAEAGPYTFVGPDNGVLTAVFDRLAPTRVVELTDPRYALPVVSRTFEGRDRFAPAAAWLASGVDLSQLGPPVTSLRRLDVKRPKISGGRIEGEVTRVDRFGNLITNIDRQTFGGNFSSDRVAVEIEGHMLTNGLVATYASAPAGEIRALFGSSNHIEIAANGANASALLGVERGARVIISPARDRFRSD